MAADLSFAPGAPFDPNKTLTAEAQQTSTDEQYLGHEFVTWQGWQDWTTGWTPEEARRAIEQHLHGWPYLAASLSRHLARFAFIHGALIQRCAPPLRTQWSHEFSRGPKWIGRELQDVFERQWRPDFQTKLVNMALMGADVVHIHYRDDIKAGLRRPVLKRWPHEAMYWRPASPAFPGGWYAITSDSGLVRMTPGDGHWLFVSHGERWHELSGVLALGELFVSGKLSERDEAGLSEAAGRASPWGALPKDCKVQDEDGKNVAKTIAGLGRARTGAVFPNGTELKAFQIASDTSFFDQYSARHIIKTGLVILGQGVTMAPGSTGVYQPLASWTVADALTDKDHEATVRGWDKGVIRPFLDINGLTSDVHLVGAKYADANQRASAESARTIAFATAIKSLRDAGLKPTQEDVDDQARRCSTRTITLGPDPSAAPPGASKPTVPDKPMVPPTPPSPDAAPGAPKTPEPPPGAVGAIAMAMFGHLDMTAANIEVAWSYVNGRDASAWQGFLCAWDESQHPREKGRFAKNGGSGKAPGGGKETKDKAPVKKPAGPKKPAEKASPKKSAKPAPKKPAPKPPPPKKGAPSKKAAQKPKEAPPSKPAPKNEPTPKPAKPTPLPKAPKPPKDPYGTGKASDEARRLGSAANSASRIAKEDGSHLAAAEACGKAATQHALAAKKCRNPEYRTAHEDAAELFAAKQEMHLAIHAESVKPPEPHPREIMFSNPAKKVVDGLHHESLSARELRPDACNLIRSALSRLPEPVQRAMIDKGVQVYSIMTVVQHPLMRHLKGQQIEGHAPGVTWADIMGAAVDNHAVLGVEGSVGMRWNQTTLHELGHTVDNTRSGSSHDASGGLMVGVHSDQKWFSDFHEAGLKNGAIERWAAERGQDHGDYFKMEGSMGRREFFAEAFARAYESTKAREHLDSHFPGLSDAMAVHMAADMGLTSSVPQASSANSAKTRRAQKA